MENNQAILEELYDEFLKNLVQFHVIMIDTCSLMESGCSILLEKMIPFLKQYKKKVVIPGRVIDELKRHYNSGEVKKHIAAQNGLKMCRKLQNEGCVNFPGDESDNFADNTFCVRFQMLKGQYHLVLITQDRNLSYDILQLNDSQINKGKPIEVYKVLKNGYLRNAKKQIE